MTEVANGQQLYAYKAIMKVPGAPSFLLYNLKISDIIFSMKIRTFFSVLLCKMTKSALRLLGRGGTDFPGLIAMGLYHNVLGELSKGVTCIIVTGTNGKTTSARMIEQVLMDGGLSYFTNKSGANLITGITAEFATNATLSGKCTKDYALIECDEAAFKEVSTLVNARAVIVTNVFRDQLDRYGEVTHTLNNIKIGISHSPDATLCLNADDSLTASIAEEVKNPVIFYGVDTPIYTNRVEEVSDAPYCIKCKHEYIYDYVTYGHLGGYRCPACGYHRPQPDLSVSKVVATDTDKSVVEMTVDGKTYQATINLPGGYNIYNAIGTVAIGKALGLDTPMVIRSLSEFSCGFGRMEKFTIDDTAIRMILVKNPAGCNQVLNFVTNVTEPSVFVVCLNDRDADGTDVSWIWDVDFEQIAEMSDLLDGLYLSGIRAEDMALRFKYAGVPESKMKVIKDYETLMQTCTAQDKPVYIMPTYTAMLDLRVKISKLYGFKNFWE